MRQSDFLPIGDVCHIVPGHCYAINLHELAAQDIEKHDAFLNWIRAKSWPCDKYGSMQMRGQKVSLLSVKQEIKLEIWHEPTMGLQMKIDCSLFSHSLTLVLSLLPGIRIWAYLLQEGRCTLDDLPTVSQVSKVNTGPALWCIWWHGL